jgi:hypothetical protein
VPVGQGNIIDITGVTVKDLKESPSKQFTATLDLDRTFIHFNFNIEKVNQLLKDHQGNITKTQIEKRWKRFAEDEVASPR